MRTRLFIIETADKMNKQSIPETHTQGTVKYTYATVDGVFRKIEIVKPVRRGPLKKKPKTPSK